MRIDASDCVLPSRGADRSVRGTYERDDARLRNLGSNGRTQTHTDGYVLGFAETTRTTDRFSSGNVLPLFSQSNCE